MRRFLVTVFFLAALLALGIGGWAFWWVQQPMTITAAALDLAIEPGTRPRGVAQAVANAGVDVQPDLLYWWFRLSGKSRLIKAGNYELESGLTPRRLLSKHCVP
ncbi:MAG: hypothetical protein NVS3B2_03570 [Ramlibacter sp.]